MGEHDDGLPDNHIREAGLDPANPAIRQAIVLARELLGFPRHLSQHVGGFVLTRKRLDETVPIGDAAMDEHTFIEWDKDDMDTLGLMKVDVLALGMLSCIRRQLRPVKDTLLEGLHARQFRRMKRRMPGGLEMLSRADSVGVFQSKAARRCRCCRG